MSLRVIRGELTGIRRVLSFVFIIVTGENPFHLYVEAHIFQTILDQIT